VLLAIEDELLAVEKKLVSLVVVVAVRPVTLGQLELTVVFEPVTKLTAAH
jgi:hypothetical protein